MDEISALHQLRKKNYIARYFKCVGKNTILLHESLFREFFPSTTIELLASYSSNGNGFGHFVKDKTVINVLIRNTYPFYVYDRFGNDIIIGFIIEYRGSLPQHVITIKSCDDQFAPTFNFKITPGKIFYPLILPISHLRCFMFDIPPSNSKDYSIITCSIDFLPSFQKNFIIHTRGKTVYLDTSRNLWHIDESIKKKITNKIKWKRCMRGHYIIDNSTDIYNLPGYGGEEVVLLEGMNNALLCMVRCKLCTELILQIFGDDIFKYRGPFSEQGMQGTIACTR